MDLFTLVAMIAVIGLVWWLLVTVIPMPEPGKTIVTIIFVVILLFVLLKVLGIGSFHVGR